MLEDLKRKSLPEIIKLLISEGEAYCRNKRKCSGLSDDDFLFMGITRVLKESKSGRDFLQKIMDEDITDVDELLELLKTSRSTYFDALASRRREEYMKATCNGIYEIISNVLNNARVDYLHAFEELDGRNIFSGDGHYINHAVHTEMIKNKYPAMGTIYMQNMRNGLIIPLCQVESENSPKPHEITFIRKSLAEFSERMMLNKPILIYDLAAIDKTFWTLAQKRKKWGWDLITKMKESIKPTMKTPLSFDSEDPVNAGVQGYYMIGLDNAGVMYLVEYVDPETGEAYEFLTTDPTLRPGLVAYLYKLRWKIEKTYDVLKNKFFETKAWATSQSAHKIQTAIIAATYNIAIFLIYFFEIEFDVKEEKLVNKRKKNLQQRKETAQNKGRVLHIFDDILPYCFQISQQFIRCLRNRFLKCLPMEMQIIFFKNRMTKYI